ncbi:hypothetical protein SEUCBS139899_008406 [Sporothrix eucalyptigena]|uniref:F-box domain-containing protein n=1 Tax=Sporothrix eucalyptigena TaxID=1812306 RepID=A0ABP0D2D8_9PEZI
MASHLERLHPELVDLVVAELTDVADFSALRLTCRTLAAKVVESPALRPHLSHKTVEMTIRSLEQFVAITASGRVPAQLLQHCTLRGIARNRKAVYMGKYSGLPPPKYPDEDPEQDQDTLLLNTPEEDPQDHLRLLTQAFCNLKKASRKGVLTTLSITVGPNTHPLPVYVVPRHKKGSFPEEVEAGTGGPRSGDGEKEVDEENDSDYVAPYELPYQPSWRAVWDVAEKTFGVVTRALATSQIQVTDEFNVFRKLVACAMPFDVFLKFLRETPAARGEGESSEATGGDAGTESNWKGKEKEARPVSVFSSLKRLKIRLSLRHRSAAEEWKAIAEAEERQMREAQEDGLNEARTIARLQAEFEAAHQAQIQAEWRSATRTLQAAIAPTELARIMPVLEEFDVGWYSVGRNMIPPSEEDIRLACGPEGLRTKTLHHLRSLSLHGMRLEGGTLLKILSIAQPEHLTLCYPQFSVGTFKPVLRYLTDPDLKDETKRQKVLQEIEGSCPLLAILKPSTITSFKLDDVMDGYVLVHYDIPGRPKFRYLNLPNLGPCTLIRPDTASFPDEDPVESELEIEEGANDAAPAHVEDPPGGVQMVHPHTRPMGSGNRWRWARNNGNAYGPPRARFDFPLLNPGMVPKPRRVLGATPTSRAGPVRAVYVKAL